jgi:Rha family phage regulatory protein
MFLVKEVLRIVGRTSDATHLRNFFASGFRDLITSAYLPDLKTIDMSMTSRQIAEVAGKEHHDIIKTTETMVKRGEISPVNFNESDYTNSKGKTYQEYNLDFDATMTVITGYDAGRRKAVIVRWREPEQGVAKPICTVEPPTRLELARENVKLVEAP